MAANDSLEMQPLTAEVSDLPAEGHQPAQSGISWTRRRFAVASVILAAVGCVVAGSLKMAGAPPGQQAAAELASTVEFSDPPPGLGASQCCPGGVFSLSACCSQIPASSNVSATIQDAFCSGTVSCSGTVVNPSSDIVCSCAPPSVDTCCTDNGATSADSCCEGLPPAPSGSAAQLFTPTGCQGLVSCNNGFGSGDIDCQCPAPQTTPMPIVTAAQPTCFPGDATVQVAGRGASRMDELHPDALVLVQRGAGLAYEPVLDFLHVVRAGVGSLYDVVVVNHAAGQLKATPSHLVFVLAGRVQTTKMAKDLKVGDVLIAKGLKSAGLEPSAVLSIEKATSSSLYAPLTSSGRLVVGGAVASIYASPSMARNLPHGAAHAAFFFARAAHALGLCWPAWGSAGLTNIPREDMHPLARFMLHGLRLDKLVV